MSANYVAAPLIRAWIEATGWDKARLARESGVDKSTLTKVLRDGTDRGLGPTAAMKIASATQRAFTSGAVNVAPLRAVDLLGITAQNDTERKAG